MQWVGHLIRVEEERMLIKILQAKFEGFRTVVRLRTQWEDAVTVDLVKLLVVRNFKAALRYQGYWWRKIRETRIQSWL